MRALRPVRYGRAMNELPFAILTGPEFAVPIIVALLIAVGVTATSLAARAAAMTQTKTDRVLRGVNLYGATIMIVMTYFTVVFNGERDDFSLTIKIVLISAAVTLTALLALAELSLTRSGDRTRSREAPAPAPAAPHREDRTALTLVCAAGLAAITVAILRRRRR